MEALDGNAIGGLLFDVFGREMTTSVAICKHCGAKAMLAETMVYVRAPGTVVRCRGCTGVLMVLVEVRGTVHADRRGVAELTPS
jgi:hypothetical protein